jgi:hypothetical protein
VEKSIRGGKIMWWYFVKLKEDKETVTYSYGFEAKELTGVFDYDKRTDETRIIKYADNHSEADQKADPLPAHLLIKEYGAPDEKMIAFG